MASAKRTPAPSKQRESVAELAPQILNLLPGKAAQLARNLGRKPSDGTVRRALLGLEKSGAARKAENGVWERTEQLPTLATPADFDAEAGKQLQRLYGILVEQSTWRDHDIDLLERYVRREMDARIYRQALATDGRFQHSAKGGRVYAHPAIDKERDANRDIASLADQLVLTPDARRRHGENEEPEQGDLFEDF